MTEELPAVRCYTCGKILASKWKKYQNLLSEGYSIKDSLNKLGITRYCCRTRMISPGKLISKVDRQEPILEDEDENIVNTGTNSNLAVLNSLSPITNSSTSTRIVLDEPVAGIELPDIPFIDVPEIDPTGKVNEVEVTKMTRSYQAW